MAFDLDAVAREATGEPFAFTFGGEPFELPASPDLIASEAFGRGDLAAGFRALLGADQWGRIGDLDAVFDLVVAEKLLEAYAVHLGIDVGNLPASPPSSASTVRPSKRTSSATTKRR